MQKKQPCSVNSSRYTLGASLENARTHIHVISKEESAKVPEDWREDFVKTGKVEIVEGRKKTIFTVTEKAGGIVITESNHITVSESASKHKSYLGNLSNLLASPYKFTRKSVTHLIPAWGLDADIPHLEYVLKLTEAKINAVEWANGRGDIEGVPQFFEDLARNFVKKNEGVKLTVFKGEELLKQGFRLMHAVGRGSQNEPTFINLSYNGNPDCKDWVAFVGKGVCFDTGGYDIKTPAAFMKDMFLDKHGAVSVLAAFFSIVEDKPKFNLTCSVGMVENFISEGAYRPSDIITSRKGLTVEIGNTDAEGRLVLADCMNWTQENYKTKTLIELSTLTGAMVMALGRTYAGLYTNSNQLLAELKEAGSSVGEEVWHMPISQYNLTQIVPRYADLTNHDGTTEAGAGQAAAFLKNFVEEGTNWVHLDIAGTAMVGGCGTGYGARILIQYVKNLTKENHCC